MKTKVTCIAILLALGFLAARASADESYRFTLANSAKIGTEALRAGDYKVVVDGPKLILTDMKTGKSVELKGRVENVDKKFAATEIHAKQVEGVSQISEIRIGGSKTKIAFD
jgi:aspartyl/asparaginyl-tRNA synthetase